MSYKINHKLFIIAIASFLFSINVYASVVVLSPNGVEVWGGSRTITWTNDASSGFVNIYRCTTSDCLSTTTIQMNVPDTGSYIWDTSGLNEINKIYVENAGDNIFDVSDTNFRLDNSISSCNAGISSNNSSTTLAKIGDSITVFFDTCESVSTTTVTIAGHIVGAVNTSGSNWYATSSMQASDTEGDISFSVSYTDFGGNTLTRVSTANGSYVIFDKTLPTISISIATTTFGVGDTATATFLFSEPVTGFSNSNFSRIDNGTMSTPSSSDGGLTWTALFSPTASTNSANNNIEVNLNMVKDKAGNNGPTVSTSSMYTINTVIPIPVTVSGGGGGFVYSPTNYSTNSLVVVSSTPQASSLKNYSTSSNSLIAITPINNLPEVLGTYSFSFLKNLKQTSTGKDVMELQKFLSKEGFFTNIPTKYFGSLTKKALVKWQIKNNLPPNGYFGPMSRNLINNR